MAYGLRNNGRPFAPTRQIGLDRLWQNPIAYRVHELSLRTLQDNTGIKNGDSLGKAQSQRIEV